MLKSSPTPKVVFYPVISDSGVAPNPFGGILSFACSFPRIRKSLNRGDVIVGLGSSSLDKRIIENRGRLYQSTEGRVLYIAKVTDIISQQDYSDMVLSADKHSSLKLKIPQNRGSLTLQSSGDCFYEFEGDMLSISPNQHLQDKWFSNIALREEVNYDLSGDVALSEEYIYFGFNHVAPASFIAKEMRELDLVVGGYCKVPLTEGLNLAFKNYIDIYKNNPLLGLPCLGNAVSPKLSTKEVSILEVFERNAPQLHAHKIHVKQRKSREKSRLGAGVEVERLLAGEVVSKVKLIKQ